MTAAADRPEFVLSAEAESRLVRNFHSEHCSVAECFREVYGETGAKRFWDAECAEPVPVARFVKLLTITCDASEFGNIGRPDLEKQMRDIALGCALVAAYQASPDNLAIFAGDLSSIKTAKYSHDIRSELKVHVRKAAEWLLAVPKRRHLVPRSLIEFVQGNVTVPAQDIPPSVSRNLPGQTKRQTGRRPDVMSRVMEAMRAVPPQELHDMLGKEMADRFNASRDTCTKARAAVFPTKADSLSAIDK